MSDKLCSLGLSCPSGSHTDALLLLLLLLLLLSQSRQQSQLHSLLFSLLQSLGSWLLCIAMLKLLLLLLKAHELVRGCQVLLKAQVLV